MLNSTAVGSLPKGISVKQVVHPSRSYLEGTGGMGLGYRQIGERNRGQSG